MPRRVLVPGSGLGGALVRHGAVMLCIIGRQPLWVTAVIYRSPIGWQPPADSLRLPHGTGILPDVACNSYLSLQGTPALAASGPGTSPERA